MEIRKQITLFWRELNVSSIWNVMIKSLKWEWNIAKQYDKRWYRRINVCNLNKVNEVLIHRLVAHVFLWLDLSKWREQCALHKNDIRNDNRVENLYVWTYKDNAVDRDSRWRWNKPKWSNNTASILKERQVVAIKNLLRRWSLFHSQIWKIYWVSRDAIQKISSWKNWKHIQ